MIKFLKLISGYFVMEPNVDTALKQFLQTEYKKDWVAAYRQYKDEGTLPNYVRRTL